MRVVVANLASVPTDAIVRPATARLDATTPSRRHVEEAGGHEFANRLHLQQELAVGAAVVTGGGGGLPAEFVIHAVIQRRDEPITREAVARAWLSALERARDWEFARLTVPPLGSGAGHLSVEDAASLMVDVLQSQTGVGPFPQEVCVVVETAEDRATFEAALRRAHAAES